METERESPHQEPNLLGCKRRDSTAWSFNCKPVIFCIESPYGMGKLPLRIQKSFTYIYCHCCQGACQWHKPLQARHSQSVISPCQAKNDVGTSAPCYLLVKSGALLGTNASSSSKRSKTSPSNEGLAVCHIQIFRSLELMNPTMSFLQCSIATDINDIQWISMSWGDMPTAAYYLLCFFELGRGMKRLIRKQAILAKLQANQAYDASVLIPAWQLMRTSFFLLSKFSHSRLRALSHYHETTWVVPTQSPSYGPENELNPVWSRNVVESWIFGAPEVYPHRAGQGTGGLGSFGPKCPFLQEFPLGHRWGAPKQATSGKWHFAWNALWHPSQIPKSLVHSTSSSSGCLSSLGTQQSQRWLWPQQACSEVSKKFCSPLQNAEQNPTKYNLDCRRNKGEAKKIQNYLSSRCHQPILQVLLSAPNTACCNWKQLHVIVSLAPK